MPIIIPREGPFFIDPNAITQEQRDKLWEQIVTNWASSHPEKLMGVLAQDKEHEKTAPA